MILCYKISKKVVIGVHDTFITILYSTIEGILYYLYFYRILGVSLTLRKDLPRAGALAAVYTVYMHFTYALIMEPFRLLLPMMMLSAIFSFLSTRKLKHTLAIVFISGMISMGIKYISAFVALTITFFVEQVIYIEGFIIAFIQIALSTAAYFTIFKINFSFIFDKEKDFDSPLLCGLTMMLFAYCSLHFLQNENYDMLSIFNGLMFVMGAVFFILYIRTAMIKHHEKIKLTEKNYDLTGRNGDLLADNHRYADWLPALNKMVEEKLSFIDDDLLRHKVKQELSLDQIPELIQNKQEEVDRVIELSETGSIMLDGYFTEQKEDCTANRITLKVIVEEDLNYLFNRDFDVWSVSRLVINNVSNAIKELIKTKIKSKEVLVTFELSEKKEYKICVFDNAHEFDLDILVSLGVRGNSTNGTGYGWEDTFNLLAQCRASLEIMEFEPYGEAFTKRITITFNGKSEFTLNSYRRDKILEAKKRKGGEDEPLC